jgi:hypothetical protein
MKLVPNPYPDEQDTPGSPVVQATVSAQLSSDEAILIYSKRLRDRIRRIQLIGVAMLVRLDRIENDEGANIHVDQGTEQISALSSELCDLAMITHTADFKQYARLFDSKPARCG